MTKSIENKSVDFKTVDSIEEVVKNAGLDMIQASELLRVLGVKELIN